MTSDFLLSDLWEIATKLAAGFELLEKRAADHYNIEKNLKFQLRQAIDRYDKLNVSTGSSSIEVSDSHDDDGIVHEPGFQPVHVKTPPTSEWHFDDLGPAYAALAQLRAATMPGKLEARKCPMAHKVPDQEDFERDFTVPGKPSDLGCPFAKKGNKPLTVSTDPIAAEFHADSSSTRSQDAGSRCPIRFLDQHSPEEIAQYFENHKHEIPRSHQICIKRYQQNEQSVRQLDAKYGNIVSMIQGLGNKHKQYLPEEGKTDTLADQPANEAVEKWAENVSHQSMANAEEAEGDDERVPRFEKPLRDVRVGESPSRPWGIPVPIEKSPAASVAPSINNIPPPIRQAATPLGSGIANQVHPAFEKNEAAHSSPRPQIIFNGPVFFGYSPEQAAMFLSQLQGTG